MESDAVRLAFAADKPTLYSRRLCVRPAPQPPPANVTVPLEGLPVDGVAAARTPHDLLLEGRPADPALPVHAADGRVPA